MRALMILESYYEVVTFLIIISAINNEGIILRVKEKTFCSSFSVAAIRRPATSYRLTDSKYHGRKQIPDP